MEPASKNPYLNTLSELKVGDKTYRYFDFNKLNDPRIAKLPISIRVLLESALRNCDEFNITKQDIDKIVDWKETSTKSVNLRLARPKSPSNRHA
jgi:aconitate hydratase